MTPHKFTIGQVVDYDSKVTPAPRPIGPFEVVRVLPAEDAHSRMYRIKSKSEPFERSAKEYEIVAVAAPTAAERAANPWLGAEPSLRLNALRPQRSR
jgi:hypothetical protein